MRRIAILGSTGSIGRNSLEVIRHLPGEFKVIGLSTNSNIDVLLEQIRRFSPRFVAVRDNPTAVILKRKLNNRIKLFAGQDSAVKLTEDKRIDLVLLAISGAPALLPLIKAIDKGKNIALANKEALVMAGNIIMQRAKAKNVKILPIDSEQSAIWQCLDGKEKKTVKRIYLTASGGPFRDFSKSKLKKISLSKVLKHPRWKMGKKVTVDSATLMNKGLELIETMRLFGLDIDKIQVVIHPEAIIHSMVEFIDGSILAQLSITDMRVPIQYALTYPRRHPTTLSRLDFFKLKKLSFYKPNLNKFPCLRLAYWAARMDGTMPCVLNASNEVAVDAFLNKKISFTTIAKVIERALGRHKNILHPKLEDIFYADIWARDEALDFIHRISKG